MGKTTDRQQRKISIATRPEFAVAHDVSKLTAVKGRFERCEQVLTMLHDDGDDPLLLLWRIARNPEVDVRTRLDAAKEVASYLHSKQSSVRVSGGEEPVKFALSWDTDDAPLAPVRITSDDVMLTCLHDASTDDE